MSHCAALILVDLQLKFLMGPPALYQVDRLVEVVSRLQAQARRCGIPTVHVTQAADGAARNASGYAIHPDLAPADGEHLIVKPGTDAFFESGLHEHLQAVGVTTLFIAGCVTELCVDTTCRRALSLRYDTTLVADGHSTPDRDFHRVTATERINLTNHVLSRVGNGTSYIRTASADDVISAMTARTEIVRGDHIALA